MEVFGLWSARVDMYGQPELIELFADEQVAQEVKAGLIGKRRDRMILTWVWEDDEDFPDLFVGPLEVRR